MFKFQLRQWNTELWQKLKQEKQNSERLAKYNVAQLKELERTRLEIEGIKRQLALEHLETLKLGAYITAYKNDASINIDKETKAKIEKHESILVEINDLEETKKQLEHECARLKESGDNTLFEATQLSRADDIHLNSLGQTVETKDSVQENIDALLITNGNIAIDVDALKKDRTTLRSEIASLEITRDSLKSETESLNSIIESRERTRDSLNEELVNFKSIRMGVLRERIGEGLLEKATVIKSECAKLTKLKNSILDDISELKKEKENIIESTRKLEDIYTEKECELAGEMLKFDLHTGVESSDFYMEKLDTQNEESKKLVKQGLACTCNTDWVVGTDKQKGKKLTQDLIKVALMIFDTIVDRAISYIRYGNYTKWQSKVIKAHETVNKRMSMLQIRVTDEYLECKLAELETHFSYQRAKQREREKSKEIRAKAAIEKREQDQLNKEQERIERELQIQEATQKAKEETREELTQKIAELQKSMLDKQTESEENKCALEEAIESLTVQLNDAQKQKEKEEALIASIADIEERREILQAGFVYIISNEGAFGKDVYKIGVTRRTDPLERINELGNASVPFRFSVHSIIASEQAFRLEYKIHARLRKYRVNIVNSHKEFFKIDAEEMIDILNEIVPQVEFKRDVEDYQYSESMRIRSNDEEFRSWISKTQDKYDSDNEEDKQLSKLGVIDASIILENTKYQVTDEYSKIFDKISDMVTGLSSETALRVTKYYIAVYLKIDSNMKKVCTLYKNGDGASLFGFSIVGYTGEGTSGKRNSLDISKIEEQKYIDIMQERATEVDMELTDLCNITGMEE